jgi:hypothetical protein
MPTPTTYPSQKQFLGLAKETTQGTAVTPSTAWVPIDNFSPEEKPTWLDVNAMYNDMAKTHGRVQGVMHTEFDMAFPCFLDTLPHLLYNILGELSTAGSAPNVHSVSLLNSGTAQPPSLTLVHWQGLPATTQARVYAGACLSELTVSGNAESSLLSVTAKGLAYPSSIYPTSAPVPTFSTVAPQAAWRYQVGLGGTVAGAPNAKIREWSVTITRELKAIWTAQNLQAPFIIQRGAVSTSGSLNVAAPSDETEFLYLVNNTQPQMQIKGSVGAAGTLFGLQIDSLLTAMDTAKINTGDPAIGYDLTWIGIANSTNVGASGGNAPAKFVVSNQTASY